jgi:hypothetical protein
MHSICKQLYVQDTPVNVFMNQIDADLVLSLCNSALPPSDLLMFNAENESPAFLRSWLSYRGVRPSPDDDLLPAQTTHDMHVKRNSPPMVGFTDFDVREPSLEFLRVWLSWFGLGSDSEKPRAWWNARATEVQELRRSVEDHSGKHLQMQWSSLVDIQRQMDKVVNFVVCSGAALAKQDWVQPPEQAPPEAIFTKYKDAIETIKEKWDHPLEQAPPDAIFAKYKDVPETKKKSKKKWKKHEKDLEKMTYASQIDVKKILAGAFNMAVVVAPLFYEPGKGLTLDRVTDLKKNATKYYDKNTLKDEEGRAKVLADFKKNVDPKLAASSISKALDMGGLSAISGAAGVLAGQALKKGGVLDAKDLKKAARKTPNSLENMAARFAMGFLVDQSKKPEVVPTEPANVQPANDTLPEVVPTNPEGEPTVKPANEPN